MRRLEELVMGINGPAAILFFAVLIFTNRAFAQGRPASSQSEGTRADQLPISGRVGQSGSVTATQAAVPGTTTSVNTINPTVQMQGPYAGSTPSTVTIP